MTIWICTDQEEYDPEPRVYQDATLLNDTGCGNGNWLRLARYDAVCAVVAEQQVKEREIQDD